jgi:RimJ/RimL family protein N-acetyltransferase
MKILETDRLILRRLTTDDAVFMLQLMNEPDFHRFVGDRGLRTTDDAATYLAEKILPSYDRFGFGFYRVELKTGGSPIGMCGLVKREALEWVDVGFAFLEPFRGKGYAFESASAVMDYGRTVLGLKRIVGITAPNNQISIRLLEKLGLHFEKKFHLPGFGEESLLFG